jgi:hypothetical protein
MNGRIKGRVDIGKILEKGVHESSVCDAGIYRFPNFHIFKQFPFQIPYNLDHCFQFSITFNNSAFDGTKQRYKIWNPFSSYIWKPLGRIEGWADTYTSNQTKGIT